jgi:hypothetical protein
MLLADGVSLSWYVQTRVASEEAKGLEGEAGHLHWHHREVLHSHYMGHTETIPDDRVSSH